MNLNFQAPSIVHLHYTRVYFLLVKCPWLSLFIFYSMIYVASLPEEVVYNSISFSASLLVMDSFSVSSLKPVHYLQRQNYLPIDSEVIDSSIYMLKRTSLTQIGNENSSSSPPPSVQQWRETTAVFTDNIKIISDKTSLVTPNDVILCRKRVS